MSQLSPQAREVASLAAAMGSSFTYDALANVSDEEEDALAESLDELWRKRIILEQGVDAYTFSHDKIRQVAYSRIGSARRRLLHRQIAQKLGNIS